MSPTHLFGIPEIYSEHGDRVDHLIDVVHWFMFALGIGWGIFLLICLVKFRSSVHPKADYHGVRNHISSHIEIAVVIIEAVLLLGFAFPLWRERTDDWEMVQKQNPVRICVVGYQFGWVYQYPGKDGIFGRRDALKKTAPNDPGIDLSDPNAQDDFIATTLKIPEKRPVILSVTSNDVIHNYSIVPMRIQQDAFPGRDIPMWFTPLRTMVTSIVCGQLCGEGHGDMVGRMEVVTQKEYDKWASEQTEGSLKDHVPKAKTASN